MLISFKDQKPSLLCENIFIAEGAKIIGDVTLDSESSVWFNTVLRGDSAKIIVGTNTNIQDNCTVHVSEGSNVVIGSNVSIGHNAVIHGCTIEDNCLIGMGSVILDGAIIGSGSIVGANSLVTSNTIVPPNSLVLGSPAKVIKSINAKDANVTNAINYRNLSKHYM